MKKLPALFLMASLFLCTGLRAGTRLTAITQPGKPAVTLQWNMVNYPGPTSYTLFKSADGVVWEISAANPVFRNYTASTMLAYRDNFSNQQRLFYRVKIYDTYKNIVDISNTAVVINPGNYALDEKPLSQKKATTGEPVTTPANVWQIYPNPVGYMLNLVYRGKNIIKGVINIVIRDVAGKTVVRFRAASNNTQLHIPVSNLHSGSYFIRIQVINDIQMNAKFIKQ